jgi:hypothetical protein
MGLNLRNVTEDTQRPDDPLLEFGRSAETGGNRFHSGAQSGSITT